MFVVSFAKSLAHLALYVFVSQLCWTCRHFGLVVEWADACHSPPRLRWNDPRRARNKEVDGISRKNGFYCSDVSARMRFGLSIPGVV
ncbi:hypothetical protein HPB50_018404 [Hyalomma asiaticum]|uniref:Uncharacterized protein n=1 Tax=Hyalomma asiaticum TaxID=266040 RepID=A0ACB7T8V9_HYAAI|nr:hypothetical protein HPB50_018404 [Hyalomma asiaticum]